MKRLRNLVTVALITFSPCLGFAATFGETVMSPKVLSDLKAGSELSWQHKRVLPPAAEGTPPPAGGWTRLQTEEGRLITLTATQDGKLLLTHDAQHLAEFPLSAPHPILLMFLENVMRSVSQETGGNPHYIRNRMRTTLGAAEVSDGVLKIKPFEGDANTTRFGPFADLEITAQWQPDDLATLLELSATLPTDPTRYSETFILQPKGE